MTNPTATDERAGTAVVDAVVLGGSAGSLDALSRLLSALPAELRLPIVVVVHLPRDRESILPAVLGAAGRVPVVEAEDKAPLQPRHVYTAPPGYHLLVDEGPSLALSVDGPVNFSQPSIDVLFESAAVMFGPRLAAVVLSGANDDGARGLAAVHAAGGIALVQDPGDATTRAMPEAALRSCPDAEVLGVAGLAERIAALDRLARGAA